MIKFGTDGWRAIIAREFTFDNLRLVVQSIGEYLSGRSAGNGVFIGYDNRFLSEEFALEAGKVLSVMGHQVLISEEAIPTPVTAFMVRELGMSGGLMLTASHNPSQYNGIKFIPHYGGPADSDITNEIESNLKKISKAVNQKICIDDTVSAADDYSIRYVSDFNRYRENLFSLFDIDMIKNSGLKVAADLMNGAAFNIFPDILKNHLQLKTVVLNDKRDPLFGGKLPDPSEENLQGLKKAMVDNDSDIGLALDGDADRFGVIDRRGVFLNPNNIISLCLYYLLNTRKYDSDDFVVRTVATTHLMDSICDEKSIDLIERPVGFKYIGKEMLSGKVIIGGEESGGLSIKGHIPEKDGLLAHLMLLEIQAFLNDKYGNYYLSDYLNDIYAKFGTFYNTRLDIRIPENKKKEVIGYFSGLIGDKIDNINAVRLIDIDGTKIIFDDGSWILIRASGTEPLMRCYIESRDECFFGTLNDYVNNKVEEICRK
ncbi:MAG: phosphoglucomutase/phosphomannomutase family protein [Actinomycetia bacterium]|nr:phosphoglucomutase/phosphomannomutase family protein [Actinomycetes bacterium]